MKTDNISKGNKVKIETVIKALEKRGMKGYYAEDGEEALKMILEMIPEGSSVGRGGSETLNQLGVFEHWTGRSSTSMVPATEWHRSSGDRIRSFSLSVRRRSLEMCMQPSPESSVMPARRTASDSARTHRAPSPASAATVCPRAIPSAATR